MSYYASFDPVTGNVTGWYDINFFEYTHNFSNTAAFIAVNSVTWGARMKGSYYVVNGTISMYPPVIIPPQETITTTNFYNRFTVAERLALSAAAISNAQIHQWTLQALTAEWINLSNTIVSNGVATLVTIGVLTSDRAKAILQPS